MSDRPDRPEPGLAALLVAGEPDCLALSRTLFPEVAPAVLPVADFAPPAPFEGPLFTLVEAVAGAAAAARFAVGAAAADGPPSPERRLLFGLVVPVVWYGAGPPPAAVCVTDHVNLAGRGPLTGRWPAGRARAFPSMTDVYRPALVAARLQVAWPADEAAAGGGAAAWQGGSGEVAAGAQDSSDEVTAAPTEAVAARWRHEAGGGAQHQPSGGRPDAGGPIYSALAVAGVADAARLTPFEARQMRRCGLAAAADQLIAPVVIAVYYGLAVAAAGAPRVQRK